MFCLTLYKKVNYRMLMCYDIASSVWRQTSRERKGGWDLQAVAKTGSR